MSQIKFEFYPTKKLVSKQDIFKDYILKYNIVFEKDFNQFYFKKKYLVESEKSHHLLAMQGRSVIGAFSLIENTIIIENKEKPAWMCCDTFILKEYRKDELILKKMFDYFLKNTAIDEFDLIIAIPNEKAALYWKKIVKWQTLTELKIQTFPLKLLKPKLLRLVLFLMWAALSAMPYFFFSKDFDLYAKRNEAFIRNRFNNLYEIEDSKYRVFSKIYIEGRFKIKYLFGIEELNMYEKLKVMLKAISKNDSDLLSIGSTQIIWPFIIVPHFISKRKINVMYFSKDKKAILANVPLINLEFFDNR
jgi:hypothetical protein